MSNCPPHCECKRPTPPPCNCGCGAGARTEDLRVTPDTFIHLFSRLPEPKPDLHTVPELGTIIHTELSRLNKEWGAGMPSFKMNYRLTRAIGRCKHDGSLDFSPKLMSKMQEKSVIETVRHEYCHYILLQLGDRDWYKHGPLFKQWAQALGCHGGATSTEAQRSAAVERSNNGTS